MWVLNLSLSLFSPIYKVLCFTYLHHFTLLFLVDSPIWNLFFICCFSAEKEREWDKEAMAGGGAPAPKADEPQPHPPKDQLPNISYCITSPPPWREFLKLFPFSSILASKLQSSFLFFCYFSFLLLSVYSVVLRPNCFHKI